MKHNQLSRRSILQAALAAPALGAFQAQGAAPNILVILADDLGFGDLSSFGARDLHTPHIDALVESGLKFSNFYANSPVCSPTRAALLSGRYSDLVGVPGLVRTHREDNWGYLLAEARLLPQMIGNAGYHSAIVGKWNLGLEWPNLPTQRGFDFFHGFLGDMMDDYYTHLRHGQNYMRREEEVIDPTGHATDLFTDWSVDYLRQRKQDKRKFFLYLAYNAPHVPIQPPDEWLEKVRSRDPKLDPKRAKIVALIEHLDASIGRVLEALKDNGQLQDTLIIFTSDNGGQVSAGANCGPWRGAKEDMTEGGIRVPMCASWLGHIKPGSHCAEVALAMDMVPTICEFTGTRIPDRLNGTSLAELFRNPDHRLPERDLLWLRRDGGMRCQGRDYYAYRSGDWKILQNHPFEKMQLYNLSTDPGETRDLAQQEQKRYKDLISRLMLHVQEAGRVPWQRA
jgi:arylsulfatase A-like enzyme